MSIKDKLNTILGRQVEVIPTTFLGKKGFIAEYFNFGDRNCASKLFSETEEGALENLLLHLETNQPGGTNGTNSQSQ